MGIPSLYAGCRPAALAPIDSRRRALDAPNLVRERVPRQMPQTTIVNRPIAQKYDILSMKGAARMTAVLLSAVLRLADLNRMPRHNGDWRSFLVKGTWKGGGLR